MGGGMKGEASNEVSGLVMSLLWSTLNHQPDLFFLRSTNSSPLYQKIKIPSSQFLLSKKDLNSCFAGFLGSGSPTNAGGVRRLRINVSQNL